MPTKKKKKFKAKNQVEQGEILPCALQTTSKILHWSVNTMCMNSLNLFIGLQNFPYSNEFDIFFQP